MIKIYRNNVYIRVNEEDLEYFLAEGYKRVADKEVVKKHNEPKKTKRVE